MENKGFELLAFPCNQFFNQENGTNEEIVSFVKSNFQSAFKLFEKVEVNGPNTHPLYRYLRSHSELYDKTTNTSKVIPWNFAKFLLNEKGEVVRFFQPGDDMAEVRGEI